MATEADTPEAISVTKEGEGRYLTSGQFDITISQCSPVQVNKSEGESDQHLETVKCFAEGENTQVGCSAQVESKNSSFGISEGGSFLASLSDSKVDKQDTCVSENSQGDESNQAEMEILDKEDQLLRGKEFGVVEETGSKEKEVEEIDKKAEQHIESHGIANDLDEHVQVISDQQDSINENPQCVEKEAKSSHEDVKGRQLADEIADSSSEQVSLLLEECSFQEDEAAVRTLDLTNNSFKKDIKPETSIDENRDNTSSTNTIFQEEFEEETGIKGLKNKAPESFDAVYEEKGPEATVFNNDKSTDDDSSSTIVAGPDIPNDEATLEAKEYAEDKLQKTSMTDDHEEKAGLEVGKKANEAPGIPDTPLITQTEETHLLEVGNPDIFEVYPEIGSEDIIKESPKEPEYQNEFLEETPEASDTASETVKDDESSERHFGSPCMKHEENTHRKGEALDVGKAKAGEEEDSQGFAAVGPIQETEQSNMNSAEHEGETETNLVEQIESAHYDIERPLNLNSEENDTETLRENTKTITTDEAERQVINLEQSFKKEGKEDTAIPSYEITKDEIPEEKVLKEPEISGGGESTTWELNKNIEIPENIVNTSTVKCEEGEQGEGKNTAPTKATEEDHRDEDPFTVEVAEEDHDYNSAISVTETSAKVTSNDEEDAPQALQKYEPGGELQNVLDVMPEEIKTETSRESAEVITCRKEERTIQNSQESSDKERKEHIESTNNTEENDTAVVEACTMAADLSTIIEEKNLEEQEIQKLSSSLVVEETTKEISEEEEIYGVILKEERKEAHAKCKEPAEGANLTQDLKSETTEERTETDKDIYAPISEGETHAEESKKTFVPKNSFLSDVPEMEIEKHFQVNDLPTVSNFDSVSGIVSQVTGLEEAETENQEQEKKNDIAPEEKVLPTIFTSEKIDVQEEENFNSKEKLENQIRTTADKPETCLKEAEAENKEHVQNIDPEEKGGETILTDKTALDIEDIAVQAGENFNSKDNLEEQIPTAADEGETFWKEAEAENKEEIKHTDIASEEKGLEIILTDETALNIEDINVQAEENLNSKDNLEKQIPTSADEGETFSNEAEAEKEEEIKHTDIAQEEKGLETILTDETALDIEDIYVQAEENLNSKDNLEKQIPTSADEGETFSNEAEAEKEEEIKHTDIAPEEKGLEAILTDETALDIEDIYVQAEENFNSKENLEEQIPTAADEGETFWKEVEAENKEEIKHTDIASEEKGLETILTDETALGIEDINVQAEENLNSKDNLEEQIPTSADEGETFSNEAEAENKEEIKHTDIALDEKGLETILTDETALDIEDIYVQAEENFSSKENLEEQIPTTADEHESCLKEAQAENKEQVKNTDIIPEEKGLVTILTDGTSLDIEDIYVQAEETFNANEKLEEQIPKAVNEGETFLKEVEAQNEEQAKNIDIAHEEKGLPSILTDETALDIEDNDVQAEENFNLKENLGKEIQTTADERETFLKEAEAENQEQVKTTDIVPEEKGLATILTDETSLDVEDIDVQAEQNFKSKENLDEQIPAAANEGETCLKEAESENKEQTKYINISPEEKGLATILTDETASEIEDSDVQAEENFNSKENLEKQFPTAANEVETCLKEAKAENKEQVKDTDIVHEEKGLATVLTDDTSLDVEDIDVQAEQNFNSKENLEEQIPTAADEDKTCFKDAETENKEQTKTTDIAPEEKGLATISAVEMALDIEDIDVKAEENFNSKEILEKQIPTAANEGETCLKEAESENKEQTKNINIAPEEKGLATTLTDETASEIEDSDVQAEENFNSKENLEKQFPTAADEVETCLKEAKAENKEQVKDTDIVHKEKGLATVLTDDTCLDVEDIDVQAEQNFNSKENLEKQFPTAADEVETCLKEAKAENKEQVEDADIVHEEKGLATVLTDDTSLDVEDIDVQAEQNFNSKENLEEQIPTAADEDKTCFKDAETENKEQTKTTDIAPEEKGLATILAVETALDIEDIDVKAEESFNSKEILEKQIITAADEGETGLKDAEAENKEQVKDTDIVHEQVKNDIAPEEKVLATILTDETSLDVEDIDVQAEQNFNSKENLEEHIPAAADEDGTCLKEAKAENKEQVKDTDIVHEEKGLATVLTDDTSMDVEDIDVQAEQNFNSKENLEEQIPTVADEDKTCFKDAETENKKQTKTTDIAPEEKGLATISTDETSLDIEDIDVKAGEIFNSKEILEQQITTAADEGETGLKDAEAENHEKVKNDIAPKERVLATILTDETASEIEDSDVQAEESFNLKENLEKQIPTAADEGETGLKESESEHNEQVENDITPEEKVLSTILTDETALDIEDIYVVAEGNFDSTDSLENQIPTEAGKTTEQSFQVQSLEEADPKLGVEDESHESEDHPEKNNMIVEEVFDEPKITGRDLNKEEILEGNVTFSPESIEEDAGNNSQEIEKEIKNVKEEGSSVESMKEGNGDDLSPEYIPEDESEKFKEDKMDAVEWKEEILEESRTAVIGESTVSETNKIAEEILNTLPVKYEEGQQGEGNIPASAKASEEEDPIEDTFPVKLAEVEDDDISTVAVIETSAKVIGEEGSPRAVQKYEPGEGLQKLLDVMPEETKAESSRENAQVITCTKEERAIQNIKESKEEDTNAINDTKQKDTGSEEFIMVLERNSREQETGVHALQEIHPQEFNDKETTEDNSTEYQACIEAADFSPKIVQGNLEEQANRELSSSLVGDNTIKESSEEEENYVSNLKEEKKEAHEECKEPIEVTNMIEEETNSETFEDKRKPNEDLCTPISEEETHAEESNSFQSEVSEKDGSTVINSDSVSGIVRHQTVLKEAEAENKEQVENTDTALDEKGLATILTDGTTLDVEGVDEQSDENSNSKEFSESQIPTVAVVDEGEEKVGLGNINLDDAPVNFQVRSLEEAEPTLRVEDENNNMIAEEVKPQLLDQVFDEPKNIEGDFNKGQIIEANAAIFSPELKEEGSSIENIKELNANDLQLESIPEDGSEKFKDDKQEAVKFKGEILQELHAAGVGEGTACETSKIAERSEEIFYTSPVKYEEGPLGEGNSPTSAKASNEEDKDEETFSVKVDEDDDSNNGAVTVTETSEKVTSNEEGDSSQSLEKYELGEEVQVKTSDLAYENKVYNLEVKASFAERTAEETSLRKEGHKEVSDLALEKLDVDATEEEIREGSEIVPKSDSQSIDVVSKDDIIACQALHEGISKEQLQIPSSTLLPEEEELKSNQHEHETTTQDKNIEEEHTHEREVPADENTGDLFSAGSVEEAHLQKEEPRELKASELSLEKLDAGESEEEIKESFEKVSKSDCLSIDAVSEDEIIADQTLLEGITDMQLQIPSHSLLPKEEELKTYEHEHGITTQDKSIEEEHAKKIEMPADENGGYFFTARSVEETILHKEEPRELKVSELAPEELNADETEEIKETFETVSKADSQSTDVVSKDEIIAYQIVHEGISKDQLQIPSSILLHEEKEIKASEDEHGTTSEEICPQKEEPKDAKVSEMALKTLDADETAEETEETCETANKFASQSINVVTEVVDDQTLCKVILKETPSTALLTGETKHATITTTEEENMSNVQIQDDENGNATSTSEEKSLPKEEPSELKVSDVELYSSKELQKESSNEVHEEERSSLIGVPEVEPHEDEEGERYDDSLLGNQKTTELKGTTMEASNLDIETSENASDCAPEEGFSRSQDATINGEHLKNEANETNETIKNEVSNEQKHLEVAISDSRAEERWCETTIEANETRKNEVSNEEIEAEKLEAKDLRPISVSGENISHREQENELIAEKYEGEKSESFSTARNENQDNEESPKETTQVAKHLTEDKELQTEENLCDTTVEANEKIKTGLSNDEIKEDKELPKDSEADSVREESHQEKKAIAEEYQVEKTSESSVIRKNENRGELPEEKDTTASKEVQTEEEEEEHENAEEVKIYEETGENEHTNAEPGYDSPVIVEASRDADAKISHKKSHNILSGIKHSISKVKKAITGKSSHSKTQSEK
ncbi:hypothetical protein L3X38_020504 [Prunus dulcis]|uniref:Titin-like n=1 Tax=Prunus dulcis TaxID=3755 RepID=A0AAD4ZCR1_PRUDU|nr:hypothetical protein L3X38_020504 [Prunus dulcis]